MMMLLVFRTPVAGGTIPAAPLRHRFRGGPVQFRQWIQRGALGRNESDRECRVVVGVCCRPQQLARIGTLELVAPLGANIWEGKTQNVRNEKNSSNNNNSNNNNNKKKSRRHIECYIILTLVFVPAFAAVRIEASSPAG